MRMYKSSQLSHSARKAKPPSAVWRCWHLNQHSAGTSGAMYWSLIFYTAQLDTNSGKEMAKEGWAVSPGWVWGAFGEKEQMTSTCWASIEWISLFSSRLDCTWRLDSNLKQLPQNKIVSELLFCLREQSLSFDISPSVYWNTLWGAVCTRRFRFYNDNFNLTCRNLVIVFSKAQECFSVSCVQQLQSRIESPTCLGRSPH